MIQDIDKLLKEYEGSASENRKMKCLLYINDQPSFGIGLADARQG
jgi:hypothetical protein